MDKTALKQITTLLPFDAKYIKVGKGKKNIKWNLMDSDGKLVSSNWFSSISKNTDGSIVAIVGAATKRKPATSATFVNVDSFASSAKIIKTIPVACFSLVDTGSIVPHKRGRYIAKAKFYGRDVFIDANGDIYDYKDNKLSILLNTVDCERFFNAVTRFNRKMNYSFSTLKNDTYNSFEKLKENKHSAWGFFWVTEDWHINMSYQNLKILEDTKKWTDDLILRVLTSVMPESAVAKLKEKFGAGEPKTFDGDYPTITWHFKKSDLNKIIETLDSF